MAEPSPDRSVFTAQRERNAALRAEAEARVARQPALAGLPLGMVPANQRPMVRSPKRPQRRFLARVRRMLEAVDARHGHHAHGPLAEAAPDAPPAPPDWLVAAGCGTCRGACCTAGGDHAFLRPDAVAVIRAAHAELSVDALVARYADALPARHVQDSCVFHGRRGCTLPRALRSGLCNRYLCGGLTQLTRAVAATGATEVVVAAADSHVLRRVAHAGDRSRGRSP